MSTCTSCVGPIKMVQGDEKPDILFQFNDDQTGDPIDISDAGTTAYFKLRANNTTTVLFTTSLTKIAGGSSGQAELSWPSGSTATLEGAYQGELSLDISGQTQTIYDFVDFIFKADF